MFLLPKMEDWKTSDSIRGIGMLLAVLLGWLYFRFDPTLYPFPKCPFWSLTGLKCPGCGSQRALHQLLHGQVGAAAQANLLFVLVLPYLLPGLALEYTAWGQRQSAVRRRWYGYRASLVVFTVVVAFWLGRNVWGF